MIPHMSTTSYIVPSLPSKSLGPSLYLAIAPLSIPPLTKTTLSGSFHAMNFPPLGVGLTISLRKLTTYSQLAPMTSLALVKAGSTSLPSNARTGQQYRAIKILIQTPFSTTAPLLSPEAARPPLLTTLPFSTLSHSITDAANTDSL